MSRRIIWRQAQSPGDILTMTAALRDLKLAYPDWIIDVRSPAPALFENSPRITPIILSREDELNFQVPGRLPKIMTDLDGNEVEAYDATYGDINVSGWNGLHYTDAFRNDMERHLNYYPEMVKKWGMTAIPKTAYSPELWISDEEKGWINQVEVEFDWRGPFWVINAGRKSDNELKMYHRWQEVVNIFNAVFGGKVKLVQVGSASGGGLNHLHPPLNGVMNLVGKTDLRQLIRLIYWSHGTIGPLSLQFVINGALGIPGVCVAGGKEGVPWHIYPQIRHLCVNGALECCKWDGCWLGGTKGQCKSLVDGVPLCFRLIKPYQIVEAVKSYYDGGRLSVNKR